MLGDNYSSLTSRAEIIRRDSVARETTRPERAKPYDQNRYRVITHEKNKGGLFLLLYAPQDSRKTDAADTPTRSPAGNRATRNPSD